MVGRSDFRFRQQNRLTCRQPTNQLKSGRPFADEEQISGFIFISLCLAADADAATFYVRIRHVFLL